MERFGNSGLPETTIANGHQRWNVWVQVPEVSENMVVPIMQMLPLIVEVPEEEEQQLTKQEPNPQIRWPSVGRVSKQCAKWVAHWMRFHVKRNTFVHALVHCGYVVLYSIMVRTQS